MIIYSNKCCEQIGWSLGSEKCKTRRLGHSKLMYKHCILRQNTLHVNKDSYLKHNPKKEQMVPKYIGQKQLP